MSPHPQRLSNTELAMIQLMRSQDDYAEFDPNVDTAMPADLVEAHLQEPKKYSAKLIATRARLFCRERLHMSEEQIRSILWRAFWLLIGLLIVLVFVAFPSGFALAHLLIDLSKHTANVLSVLWLGLVTAALVLIPILSLCFLLVHRLQGRKTTSAAMIVIRIFRAIVSIAYRLAARIGLVDDKDINEVKGVERVIERYSYFGAAVAIFTVNLYFLAAAFALCWGMVFHLATTKIDFYLEDSISQLETRSSLLRFVSPPVELLTGVSVPSEDAIAWAGGTWAPPAHEPLDKSGDKSDDESSGKKETAEVEAARRKGVESEIARLKQNFRVEWSRFLLAFLFTWIFFPRLLVALVSLAMIVAFRRDFVPDSDDPGIARILNNIVAPPIGAETVTLADDQWSADGELTSAAQIEETHTIAERHVAARRSRPAFSPNDKALVVAVGGNPDLKDAVAKLVSGNSQLVDGGVLRSARERREFRKNFNELRESRLVLVFSLLEVPAQNIVEFVEWAADVVYQDSRPGAIDIVLSDGEQARERLDDDVVQFQERLRLWTNACIGCGIPEDCIHAIDLSTTSGVDSCRSLITATSAQNDSLIVKRMAGKYPTALSRMRGELESLPSDKDQLAAALMITIDEVYKEERVEFRRCLSAKPATEALRKAVQNGSPAPQVLDRFMQDLAFLKNLSPRWIGAGALAGLSLCLGGAAAAGVPAVALIPMVFGSAPTSAVLGGVFAQWLRMKTAPGKATKQEEPADRETVPDIDLKSVVQMAILKILILEFQGSSEQFISDQIREQTERLSEDLSDQVCDYDRLLLKLESNLDEVKWTIK